jgi:hypothetical protein
MLLDVAARIPPVDNAKLYAGMESICIASLWDFGAPSAAVLLLGRRILSKPLS